MSLLTSCKLAFLSRLRGGEHAIKAVKAIAKFLSRLRGGELNYFPFLLS